MSTSDDARVLLDTGPECRAGSRETNLEKAGKDVAACLNHVRRDVTGRHYDMYARLIEKRRALDLWAQKIEQLIIGHCQHENVLPMLRTRRPAPT
jgi:hypothetical protein